MQENHNAVLKHHGKSFYFARLFLPKKTASGATSLYAFCRALDDIADNAGTQTEKKEAVSRLEHIRQAIHARHKVSGEIALIFENLKGAYQISPACADILIGGVKSDLSHMPLKTKPQLLKYCYDVAGIVGLMMCPVLGTKHDDAFRYAIDLGVAMQLTNIARDVDEDARAARRYIPADMGLNIPPEKICDPGRAEQKAIRRSVKALLDLADAYYRSGMQGLAYLGLRERLSIGVAALIYREIGQVIRRRDYAVWEGRAYVGSGRKMLLAGYALLQIIIFRRYRVKELYQTPYLQDAFIDSPFTPFCNGAGEQQEAIVSERSGLESGKAHAG